MNLMLTVSNLVLAQPGASQPRTTSTRTTSSPSATRSQTQDTLVRDSSTCVLSGENSRFNEVAHIFPYSIGRSSPGPRSTFSTQHPNFYTFLHLFAGAAITSTLESYLLSPIRSRTRINGLENLFTLTPLLHRMWDDCVFTLIPVGDPLAGISDSELTSYDVSFQWLPKRRPAPVDLTQVLNQGPQLTEEEDPDISGPFVINRRTNTGLVSGTIIRLHTSDPTNHPLPHPDLLRLHAAIARVVRCAGASGEKQGDDYCGEDDELEDPALEIDSMREEEIDSMGEEEVDLVGEEEVDSIGEVVDSNGGEGVGEPENSAVLEKQSPAPCILGHRRSKAPR
ncbi:hypothetical protein BGX38DRAFT_1182407, partial [Terfezia claveryi]